MTVLWIAILVVTGAEAEPPKSVLARWLADCQALGGTRMETDQMPVLLNGRLELGIEAQCLRDDEASDPAPANGNT